MKITAGKRDDIVRRRDEFDADRKARQDVYDRQYATFRAARKQVYDSVSDAVKEKLGGSIVDALHLQVTSDLEWIYDRHLGPEEQHAIKVEVKCENRSDDNALRWDWGVYIDPSTGEAVKSSGSWSGLNAITAAQVESLRKSVAAIEILNSIDWATLLNKELPKSSDYVTESNPEYEQRPNFERELLEADIEDAIESGDLIKMSNYFEPKYYRGTVYLGVISESPKQYKVYEVHASEIDNPERIEAAKGYAYGITKERFMSGVQKPLETIKGGN